MVKFKQIFSSLIFYLSILTFFIGFQFSDTMVGGWYQQFMPNLGTKQINDIIFLDSLTGFAIASKNINPDTSSILKTANGGDSWQVVFTQSSRRFSRVIFINSLTGFISGGSGSGTPYLYKTTDGGNNWNTVPGATLGNAYWNDMAVLSENTIWLADANGFNGGVFLTTNGGLSWQQQPAPPSDHIYMFNARIGFIHRANASGSGLFKTTNGGQSWNIILSNESFTDMYFIDSLTGWKADYGPMKKTTDGGINWINQQFPPTYITGIIRFTNINADSIWGVGGTIAYPNNQTRGIIYKTTNGGNNWGYQIPDTITHIFEYFHSRFINKLNGWAYATHNGVHTVTGGDTLTIYGGIKKISSNVPHGFFLYQNYPNPFNPTTKIKYEVSKRSNVRLEVFDITGKEVMLLVEELQHPGTYEAQFSGNNLSSGVYFYSLYAEGRLIDTKRMILIK